MKEAWVHLESWSKEMVTAALEGGADAIVAPSGWCERIRALGQIPIVSPDGDLKTGTDVFFERLETPQDEVRIAGLMRRAPVVLAQENTPPEWREEGGESQSQANPHHRAARGGAPSEKRAWEVIPLENLVATGGRLLVPVHSAEDIELALGVLEKGAAGVVIHARDPREVKEMLARVKVSLETESLKRATIESIRPAGMGDRVCVDTCVLMEEGEGALVGNSSGFLFLVQAETKENPYVAARPFRVNAGPVHAYVRVPGGRTRYLSELEAGDPLLVVRWQGATQIATVGRVKIERRPLILVQAHCEGASGSILLQNAETIRLTLPNGEARSILDLRVGDSILVSVEEAGRHFGMKIDETIREK